MKRQNVRKLILVLSFILFPITFYYFSPALIIQGAFEGLLTGSFIVFVLQFLSGLFLGRTFCGWLCPAGGLQEICAMAVEKRARVGRGRFVKYIIWVLWIALIALALVMSKKILKVDFFYQTLYGISMSDLRAVIIYFTVILLFLIPFFIKGRRGACHTICWMAPFMVLGTKTGRLLGLPTLKLNADPLKCIDCKKCTRACQMSLDVNAMVQKEAMKNTDCILCLECVDSCPKKAISLGFGKQLSVRRKVVQANEIVAQENDKVT